MAPAESPSLENNPIAATAAVSTSPALATELHSQAVAETSPAQAIVALPTQAASLFVGTVSSPTRAVTSVSTHSGRKHF